MMSSYLIFRLSGRLFGVRLLGALEIVPWKGSRPVPLSYPHVAGLTDYRGNIYPVLDLVSRLGMSKPHAAGFPADAPAPVGSGKSIIFLEENTARFGVIVDAVEKMAKLEDPAGTPEKAPGVDSKYVKGVVFEDGQEILILDLERLLHAS